MSITVTSGGVSLSVRTLRDGTRLLVFHDMATIADERAERNGDRGGFPALVALGRAIAESLGAFVPGVALSDLLNEAGDSLWLVPSGVDASEFALRRLARAVRSL